MVSRAYTSAEEAMALPGAMEPEVVAYRNGLAALQNQAAILARQLREPPLRSFFVKREELARLHDAEEDVAGETIAKLERALADVKANHRAALRKTRCRDAATPRTGAQ